MKEREKIPINKVLNALLRADMRRYIYQLIHANKQEFVTNLILYKHVNNRRTTQKSNI